MTSTSSASKLAAKCRQACRSDKQISDVTMAFESVEKHDEDSRMRLRFERPPKSQRDFNTVLERTMLTSTATPDSEQPRPPHPLRQHPVHQPGQESQHQDQASLGPLPYKGEMRAHPAPASAANHEGWTPWSSEDVYAHHSELNHDPRCFARRHSEGETLLQLRCEPSDANLLPAYYDPGPLVLPSYHGPQKTAGSAIDMPLRKTQRQRQPSVLSDESCKKPPPPPRNPKRLTMSKTPHSNMYEEVSDLTSMEHHEEIGEILSTTQHGSVRKSAINIIRLRPHPSRPERSSSITPAHVLPSPLGSHPTSMKDTGEFPMPPIPPKNSRRSPPTAKVKSSGKDRPFDVAPKDQHKTNVRRPPKGIQHWFDAYISSDDEDEDEDEQDVEIDEPEPQELPAEDVLRPAYTPPERGSSLGADNPALTMKPTPAVDTAVPYRNAQQSPVESDSSNSIQSSHCRGRKRTLGVSRRLAATNLTQESVLSLSSSSSDYSDDDDSDEFHRLPAIRDSIRDSILDDRNFEVASAASIRVQRLLPPEALNAARGARYNPKRSTDDSQSLHSSTSTPLTQMQYASLVHEPHDDSGDVDATLRRLNGSSSDKNSANSTTPSTSDAAHVIAVTDEEMMFLEMMRKKRAEMKQESFTEGYSVALQTEQQRLAKRTVSAPLAALKVLQQRERNEQSRHEQMVHDQERRPSQATSIGAEISASEMQRQLDDIRRAQVDERFQIERFLGMSSPSQLSCETPTNSRPNEILLPATVYTPAGATARHPTASADQSNSEDQIEVQRRVEQFIASQGAVPPLNNIRTMRRPSHQALSPTRVVEQAMPPIAPLRKIRTGSSSGADPYALQHKVSVMHHSHAGMQRTSPVSAFSSHSSPTQNFTTARPSPTLSAHPGNPNYNADAVRPRTASAPVNRRVMPRRSLPRINTDESLSGTQRSTLDDVRDGWHNLGGVGFAKPSGSTSHRVQT